MTPNKLDQFAHNEIINSLIAALNEHYIFADIAKEIEKDLSLSLAPKENMKISKIQKILVSGLQMTFRG